MFLSFPYPKIFAKMYFLDNLKFENSQFPSKLPFISFWATSTELMFLEENHQAVVVHMVVARLRHALVLWVVVLDHGGGAILERE